MNVFATRRFRPGFWPTLAAVAMIAATIALGNWQRHRAAEKEALRAQYELTRTMPPVSLSSLAGELQEHPQALRYRFVSARGEYDAGRQAYIDNRVHAGQPGYEVITPLRLEGQPYSVLVDRGWIAQGSSRAQLPPVPVPSGMVQIEGRLNLPPVRYLELSTTQTPGMLWQNLDPARMAKQFGISLLPLVMELQGPAEPNLLRDWVEPDFGREQHISYMVQWYSLAALTVVLWLTLNWRKA